MKRKKVALSTVHVSHGVYRCDECNGVIDIGVKYHRNFRNKEKLCDNCFVVEAEENKK